MATPNPEYVFSDGGGALCRGQVRSLELKRVGEITLVSGRVLACDPFAPDELVPFERTLPAGTYPVVLTLADMGDERRVAYATIQLGDTSRISRWTMATRPGERVADLGEGDLFAYPVDSGTGCFVDAAAAAALQDDDHMRAVMQQYEEMRQVGWSALQAPARAEDGGANAVLFSSGDGDGVYASYFGFTEAGDVAALTTVFDVVDSDLAAARPPAKRAWWRFWE